MRPKPLLAGPFYVVTTHIKIKTGESQVVRIFLKDKTISKEMLGRLRFQELTSEPNNKTKPSLIHLITLPLLHVLPHWLKILNPERIKDRKQQWG